MYELKGSRRLTCPTCWFFIPNVLLGFPSGSVVKNPSTVQETRIGSLGWEDPMEKEMATHSSVLARKILWTEKLGKLWSMVSLRVGYNWSKWAMCYWLGTSIHVTSFQSSDSSLKIINAFSIGVIWKLIIKVTQSEYLCAYQEMWDDLFTSEIKCLSK